MVSTINMVLMLVCVVVGIAAAAVPYLMINKRSSALETGLPGAVGYGVLGYVWQYVLYMFGGVFIARFPFWGRIMTRHRCMCRKFLIHLIRQSVQWQRC